MSREENVEVVRHLYDALTRRDLARMDELSHGHAQYHPRVGQLQARVYGYGELGNYFADLDEVWDDLRQTAEDIEPIDESRVLVTVRYQARARVSGLTVDQRLGVIATLTDGKVELIEAYSSPEEARQAAGATP